MRILKQMECHIPEWAIGYIEYGESDSLTVEDCAEVDKWLRHIAKEGYTSPTFDYHWDHEANGFYHYPEFGLGAGCIRTTVTQFTNE